MKSKVREKGSGEPAGMRLKYNSIPVFALVFWATEFQNEQSFANFRGG